jgi:hypothetical protein
MQPKHPVGEERALTLAACPSHPLAVGKRDLSIRKAIEPILQESASPRSPLLEVGSTRMLVELAQIGDHASIMTPIGAHNAARWASRRGNARTSPRSADTREQMAQERNDNPT